VHLFALPPAGAVGRAPRAQARSHPGPGEMNDTDPTATRHEARCGVVATRGLCGVPPGAVITEPSPSCSGASPRKSVGQLAVGGAQRGRRAVRLAASPGVVEGPPGCVMFRGGFGGAARGRGAGSPPPDRAELRRRVSLTIAATVTDVGGIMSHAAICAASRAARVTGPRRTKNIKTGQSIRVDRRNAGTE